MSWRASGYMKMLRICPNGERITRNEKLVGLVLADSHQDKSHTYTFPSVEGIAEDSIMSKRECQRVLASLEAKGVIQRVRPEVQFRGVTTFYRFPALEEEGRQAVTLPDTEGRQKGGQKGDRRVTKTAPYIEEQEQEQKQKTKAKRFEPGIQTKSTEHDTNAALNYWKKMKDSGQPIYAAQAPGWVRRELEGCACVPSTQSKPSSFLNI